MTRLHSPYWLKTALKIEGVCEKLPPEHFALPLIATCKPAHVVAPIADLRPQPLMCRRRYQRAKVLKQWPAVTFVLEHFDRRCHSNLKTFENRARRHNTADMIYHRHHRSSQASEVRLPVLKLE